MGEMLFIVSFVGLMIGWPFLIKNPKARWFWFYTMAGCMVWFGIMEAVSKFLGGDGKTLSKYFWEFSLEHPTKAAMALGLMLGAWLILLLHLAWKRLRKIIK